MKRSNELHQIRAFNTVVSLIDSTKLLPEQVFRKSWSHFFFFQSDQIFAASFVDALTDLIRVEGGTAVCLLNYNRTSAMEFDQSASLFIDEKMGGAEYYSRLQDGGPSTAWLYHVDRYGCASDSGQWCIYCEKTNDVAVIALQADEVAKFSVPLKKLRAEPIQALLRGSPSELFPFSQLTSEWRSGLSANYGR